MRITLLLLIGSVLVTATPAALAADPGSRSNASVCALAADPLSDSLSVDVGSLSTCEATADCAPFGEVSCEASGGSSTCTAVDRDCSAGQRGYVDCDGARKDCAETCCGADGTCEFDGCGCSDPDCSSRPECQCEENGSCNLQCGCDDPDCWGTRACPCSPECSSVTDCTTDADCLCPGSLCLSDGTCLCAG